MPNQQKKKTRASALRACSVAGGYGTIYDAGCVSVRGMFARSLPPAGAPHIVHTVTAKQGVSYAPTQADRHKPLGPTMIAVSEENLEPCVYPKPSGHGGTTVRAQACRSRLQRDSMDSCKRKQRQQVRNFCQLCSPRRIWHTATHDGQGELIL